MTLSIAISYLAISAALFAASVAVVTNIILVLED